MPHRIIAALAAGLLAGAPSSPATGGPAATAAPGGALRSDLAQILEGAFPLRFGQPGDRITFSRPTVSFPSGDRVVVRVRVKHKKTRGLPRYTASGKGTLTGRLDLGPTRACVVGLALTDLNLRKVNDFLDRQHFQKELNDKMHTVCFPPGCTWDPTRTAFCATLAPAPEGPGPAATGGSARRVVR